MAGAATWTILALALPLFWQGAFTFAIRSSITQEQFLNEGLPEPRQLTSLALMAFVLGLTGGLALWRVSLLTVVAGAAIPGAILFAAVYAVDPMIRTTKQMLFLAMQCVLWGVGVFAAILGLTVG